MRRALIFVSIVLLFQAVAFGGTQPDKLEGRWAGIVDGIQGQQPAAATFKKEGGKGGTYSGSISGLRPGADAVLKDINLDGDKVTAKTEVDTPQGSVVVSYAFVVQGETLKGKGEVEFGGQTYTFTFDLKRGAEMPAGAATQAQPPARREVPQPQQKQSISYFVGEWSYSWIGRESALGPAPREGTTTFTLRPDGKSLDVRTAGKSDNTSFNESAVIIWDEATKMLTFSEKLANGIQVQSKGDWRSPISIRFTVDPIKVKGQTLQLKRIISVVAAHSFTVTEELSENGGPFVRLGSAVYTKTAAAK
ncbi:MAG TPA: hypothetical protein VN937_26580 [Blastocatellia bacterium]|nr:hypothetical protein [Blastocatellia bacterium]